MATRLTSTRRPIPLSLTPGTASQLCNFGPFRPGEERVTAMRVHVCPSAYDAEATLNLYIAKFTTPPTTVGEFTANGFPLLDGSTESGPFITLVSALSLLESVFYFDVPIDAYPDLNYPYLSCVLEDSSETLSWKGFCAPILDYFNTVPR